MLTAFPALLEFDFQPGDRPVLSLTLPFRLTLKEVNIP